jgi:hypothetical protein
VKNLCCLLIADLSPLNQHSEIINNLMLSRWLIYALASAVEYSESFRRYTAKRF